LENREMYADSVPVTWKSTVIPGLWIGEHWQSYFRSTSTAVPCKPGIAWGDFAIGSGDETAECHSEAERVCRIKPIDHVWSCRLFGKLKFTWNGKQNVLFRRCAQVRRIFEN
jgi:hypothetical protein